MVPQHGVERLSVFLCLCVVLRRHSLVERMLMSQMNPPLQPSTEEAPYLCEHIYNVFIANDLHCDTSMVSAQVLCRNNSVKHV